MSALVLIACMVAVTPVLALWGRRRMLPAPRSGSITYALSPDLSGFIAASQSAQVAFAAMSRSMAALTEASRTASANIRAVSRG